MMSSTDIKFLTLDGGNSHPHIGLCSFNDQEIEVMSYDQFIKQSHLYKHQVVVVSDVGRLQSKKEFDGLKHLSLRPHFQNQQFLGMRVNYADTLGDDRLFQARYIFDKFKGTTLFIDAGTFTTIDIVNSDGFEGGYIYPGVKALCANYRLGAKLPTITPGQILNINNQGIPHQTEEAIYQSLGIILFSEVEKMIKKYQPDQIITTGGQGSIYRDYLTKFDIKIIHDDHLIHRSLKYLYEKFHLGEAKQ